MKKGMVVIKKLFKNADAENFAFEKKARARIRLSAYRRWKRLFCHCWTFNFALKNAQHDSIFIWDSEKNCGPFYSTDRYCESTCRTNSSSVTAYLVGKSPLKVRKRSRKWIAVRSNRLRCVHEYMLMMRVNFIAGWSVWLPSRVLQFHTEFSVKN